MTNCGNPELRDELPDFVAQRLPAVESARVQRHLAACDECASELAIIQMVRALRPSTPPVSIASVVAALPRPTRSISSARSVRNRRHLWQIAAAIGVVLVGGGSLLVSRSGGFDSVTALQGDSMRAVTEGPTETMRSDSAVKPVPVAAVSENDVAVSFGNMGNYSDDELDQILRRLEQWDGATSTESMTTPPIIPVNSGGTNP